MAEFQWKFQRRTGSATLGGTLEVQQTNGRTSAVTQDISGFYVDGAMFLDELIIAHHVPLSTKTKLIRVLGDRGQLDPLVAALAAARPSADLRTLPRSEALKQLGAIDARRLAMFIVPTFPIVAAFVISLPALTYGLDRGEERLSVAELGTRPLKSRNVVLTGEVDTDNYTWATAQRNGMKVTTYSFFPLRPPGAPKDAPLKVMLYNRGGKDVLPPGPEWRCTIHDALGDGFSDQHRQWFREDKLNVTDDTKLCDMTRTPQSELTAALTTNGIAIGVGLLTGLLLWFNGIATGRRKLPQTPHRP